MITLVLGLSLVFVVSFIYYTREMGMREVERRGATLVHNLAWNSELGVLSCDKRFMEKPMDSIYKEDDVVYVIVYDASGVLCQRKSKINALVGLEEDIVEQGKIDDIIQHVETFDKQRVYEFTTPITTVEAFPQSLTTMLLEPETKITALEEKRKIIGYARVGLSLSHIEESISNIIDFGLSVILSFLMLGILATYMLAKMLTKQINVLTKGVKSIRDGHLDQRIALTTKDEIADLAEAFNEMSQRLQHTIGKLKEKNEELEDFVHTVSHDLKSPLVSIQGFATNLLKKYNDNLDERGRFYLERIQKNVEHMDQLICDLLALSRVGKLKDTKDPVDITQVIKEIKEELEPALKKKHIQLLIPDNLPVIFGYQTRIIQLFSNFITNAIKFIGNPPEPKIEILYHEDKDYYHFGVKDNGIGIDEQHHDRIFGLFQRLKETEAEGTGIGLAIVKKIVDSHGGKVWVQSEKGKGCTFFFIIPK